jgi:hypothetical protein
MKFPTRISRCKEAAESRVDVAMLKKSRACVLFVCKSLQRRVRATLVKPSDLLPSLEKLKQQNVIIKF